MSTVLYMESTDHGKIWKNPVTLSEDSTEKKVDLSKHNVWGSQGSSLTGNQNNDLFVSWAGYHNGAVKFAMRTAGSPSFSNPKSVATSDMDTPITQIASDPSGKNLIILLNEAHIFGKVYWMTSHNSGKTWSQKKELSSSGIMPVASVSNSGRIAVLWSERNLSSGVVKTQLAVSNDHGDRLKPPIILGTSQLKDTDNSILLDNQALDSLSDGTLQAFWINLNDDAITSWQSTLMTQ